jgi:aspartate aminotransferase
MLSERANNISPSATMAIDSKAKQLKKEGKDVVIFGAGEPDFNTPENIKQAAIKSINDNITRYTPVAGLPILKNAIIDKFKRINGINYDVSEVIVGCGGKHVLYNIMQCILDKGDEAILPAPFWVSFEEMIKLGGAKPVICRTDERFKLTSKDVKKSITEKTKLLILNSPSNPSGAIVDREEIKKIARLAVDNNLYVISDEVYEYFTYGKEHLSIASLNEDIKNLTITANSFSKTYAMTGWRVGYCGASKEIIKAISNLQGHSTSNTSNAAQMAALEALQGPQDSIQEMVKAFDERRKFTHKRLNEIEGVSCVEPEGAFYAFPNISAIGLNSMDFSAKLLDEALVALVPGSAFGCEGHVRISYATSIEELTRGMDRIEKFVKTLK